MSDVLKKLERLYKLAVIRPEEEKDEGRNNEARNAAFLLIKTARENGVKLKFEMVTAAPPMRDFGGTPQRRTRPPFDVNIETGGTPFDVLNDLFQELSRERHQRGQRVPDESFFDDDGPLNQPAQVIAPKIIVSKFGGTCKACMRSYAQGARVWWRKGSKGCTHEACGPRV